MKKNKNGPTLVFKGGSRGSVWLKHKGNSVMLNNSVGELPGGAIFKVSESQALNMLTSEDMFRVATKDEVKEHISATVPKEKLKDQLKVELSFVVEGVSRWKEKKEGEPPKEE